MNLYEYEAYEKLFKKYGVPTPRFMFGDHLSDDIVSFINQLGECVIKSQVLVGKRGKAGAVKLCKSPEEAIETFNALLNYPVYGEMPVGLLVTEKANILKELKMGRCGFQNGLSSYSCKPDKDQNTLHHFNELHREGAFRGYKERTGRKRIKD